MLVGMLCLVSHMTKGHSADTKAEDQRPSLDVVLDKMQAFYLSIQDFKGKFKQEYVDTLYNRRRIQFGYVYVKKPGMMRWNYAYPEKKSFIADGKNLWVYEPEDNQAFQNPLSTDTLSSGLLFLFGKGDLKKEFIVSYAESPLIPNKGAPPTPTKDAAIASKSLLIKLAPKLPSPQYTYLLLNVSSDDFSVTESIVIGNHSRNHFYFSKVDVNTHIPAKLFAFKPPPGTRVIDH